MFYFHNKIGDTVYINIILKTITLYFLIILAYRIMGKKEVGKLSIIDLIVSILIAELAAICIEEPERGLFTSIIPITILVLVQVLLSYASLKSYKIRDLLDGKPAVIINNGKVNFNEMIKLRYTLDDLLSQLREQSVKSISDVKYAILENNGKLSVFQNNVYPLPIIIDGIVEYQTLNDIDKDYKWLMKILKEQNLKKEDVFYAFYTGTKVFIIKKNDLI